MFIIIQCATINNYLNMCYNATWSGLAFLFVLICTVYKSFSCKIPLYKTQFMIYWATMEFLQMLGYLYPANIAIPYLLMIHTATQPIVYFSGIVMDQYSGNFQAAFEKYKLIYFYGIVSTALYLVRMIHMFSPHTLPCNEIFCSLYDNDTPRCITENLQHMTWSVPMGPSFNNLYITPTLYYHFTMTFLFPMLINPTITLCHIMFIIGLKYLLFQTTGNIYLDDSIVASIWCYIGIASSIFM